MFSYLSFLPHLLSGYNFSSEKNKNYEEPKKLIINFKTGLETQIWLKTKLFYKSKPIQLLNQAKNLHELIFKAKELSFCPKLKCSNPYISATRWCISNLDYLILQNL